MVKEEGDSKMYVNNATTGHELHVKSSSSLADLRSPTPCPGSRGSSADGMHATNQNMAHLKDEIVKEIKRELSDPLHEMLTKILNEVQTFKGRTETIKTYSNVSCQTEWPVDYGDNDSANLADCNTNYSLYDIPRPLKEQNKHNISDDDQHYTNAASITNVNESQTGTDFQMKLSGEKESDVFTALERRPFVQPRNIPNLETAQGHAHSKIFHNNSFQSKGKVVQVKPRQKSEVQATRVHPADRRDCFANTLQFHIEVIVDGLAYHVDNLLDDLVLEGCLTRDECESFKHIGDRKDRTRALISLTKGRDLNVLDGFMKNVKRYNEEVAHKILVDVERSSVQKGAQKSTCVICKIEQDINIKDVADSLWSVKAIDDNLYGQIIRPESNSEEQKTLWKKVFQSVNSLHTEHFDSAKIKLMDCLTKHSVSLEKNDYIFEKNQTKLICTCELDIGCKSIDLCSGASGTVIKPDLSNPSGESISNPVVIPVIHGGKRNNSVPVCKTAHLNASATGNDRKFFDSLMKPPVLPKRPSSLRRHSKGDLRSTISPAKSLDTSDVSLYDTPRTYLTLPRCRSSEQTSALDDAPQEFCTDEAINDQSGKSLSAKSGIPALPVKKSKFPAWKKAKEQGPSFV